MASRKYIQQLANSLIEENPRLPIAIDKIIKNQGLKLVPYDHKDGISGILMIEQNSATIGYASNESPQRQRFTKAHELGHFMLHRGGNLFIDKDFKTMYRPASSNAPSTEWQEWEANEFAACILMPEHLVKEEMKKIQIDYADDSETSWIEQLAKKFKVSVSAMSIRISRLGLQ
ncbi:MAG: ImmA/IrrE family metallo-endopeptidase [Sediminibacterium sp.]|nr:ImmA/IrrE family metallo-endopeptidase [Sediminibacterium sp.]